MNLGLSDELKANFPNVKPVLRPAVGESFKGIPDPNWVAGFTDGEGSFNLSTQMSPLHKLGGQGTLRFSLTQHDREAKLMASLKDYFGCGSYYLDPSRNRIGKFIVSKFSDIDTKILPFFKDYPLQGVKSLDLEDFKKIVEIFRTKDRQTNCGRMGENIGN